MITVFRSRKLASSPRAEDQLPKDPIPSFDTSHIITKPAVPVVKTSTTSTSTTVAVSNNTQDDDDDDDDDDEVVLYMQL